MFNSDILQGKTKVLRGLIKEKWGELTDDDMAKIDGNKDKLFGLLQEKFGVQKEQFEDMLKEWNIDLSDLK